MIGLIVLVVLAELAVAGCTARRGVTSRASRAVRVGGAFALTGEAAGLDASAASGAQLAVTEINAAGGLLGHPVELVMRDTRSPRDATSQIARELVERDKVHVVVGFTDSAGALAAGPVIRSTGVPVLAVGATSPRLPSQLGDRMFLVCFGDNAQAAVAAEFGVARLGRRAAVVWDRDFEFTRLLAGYFRARFKELGGTVVLDESYPDKTTNFSAQIARLKALPRPPDFYFVSATPHNAGLFLRQLRAAGLRGPVIGGDGYDTPDLVRSAGAAAENVFFTTHALMGERSDSEAMRRFTAAYRERYGQVPERPLAALGYDAIRLLADVIRRAGSTEPSAVATALEETSGFTGLTGTISYGPGVRVPRKAVTVIAVKNGRLTRAAELVPEKIPPP